MRNGTRVARYLLQPERTDDFVSTAAPATLQWLALGAGMPRDIPVLVVFSPEQKNDQHWEDGFTLVTGGVMRQLTFKRYVFREGDTLPAIRWTFLPVDLDQTATLTAAGFDPMQPFWFGVLPAPWRSHPQSALVVTGKTLAPGESIAVSIEPAIP